MQRFSHDQILDEINTLFDWNPPLLSAHPSASPKLNVPSCFYYNHLDDKLSLKKIIPMPDLIPNLSATVDRVLQDIKEHNIVLPPVLVGDLFPGTEDCKITIYNRPITDAYSVSKAYQNTTAYHCRIIASMLLLSPRSPTWKSLLKWNEIELGAKTNPGLDEAHALYMEHNADEDNVADATWNSVEGETVSTLLRIIRRSPILALWEIFSITPANENLLQTLGEPPIIIRTVKEMPRTTSLLRDPDAVKLSWGAPMLSLSGEVSAPVSLDSPNTNGPKGQPRRGLRSQKGATAKSTAIHSSAQTKGPAEEHTHTITLPKREPGVESLSGIMLKHAWLKAVHKDSTYVVFHCGTLERIAFRHRGSQTLYISGLVDVAHSENPGYGKIHIGLYISIIDDALDRMRQRPKEGDAIQSKKRRREENAPGLKPKRPRTRALAAKLEADEVEHAKACDYLTSSATRCDLIVLRMCYGVYNSPSPSFFLRSDRSEIYKMKFKPREYLSVTLTSDIAAGATGVVHGAKLVFTSEAGVIQNMSAIVKFSMKRDQRKRLRHEYSIYKQLASSHVKGVPRAIGLFKDHNSSILALVMTHTGTCLSDIYPETRFVVEEPQRSSFLRVMSDIHTAGVRHRDIRPENLTVDDEGRVFIIDFDMAEISPTEGAKARELAHLIDLLDGRYLPPNEFPSERTNPRSSSRSESGSESRGRRENGSGRSSSTSTSSQSSTAEE